MYQLSKKAARERRPDANAQLSRCALPCCAGDLGCLVKLVKCVASPLKEPNAGVCNSHASVMPFKQRYAEFVFERTGPDGSVQIAEGPAPLRHL